MDKTKRYLTLMNKWMYLRNMGLSICSHDDMVCADSMAVYGLGMIGKRLVEELINNHARVLYVVDKVKQVYISDIDFYTVSEKLPQVDLMIVTPFLEYESIVKGLPSEAYRKALSVEAVIEDLFEAACNMSYRG